MTNDCGIYKITNTVTGDFYIGSSCNLRLRIQDHKYKLVNNKHANRHLQNSYNKHGEQVFVFEIVLLCEVEYKLYFEQKFLDLFKPAYNIAANASAPWQGLRFSEEHKRKISEGQSGDLNHNFGKPLSEEAKCRLSEVNKGKVLSEETCAKMSESKKGENNPGFGKHWSEEQKRRLSEANKGELSPNFGKHQSDETRRKKSEAMRGKSKSEEHKRKLSEAAKTRPPVSEETKRKLSEAAKRYYAEKQTTKEQ